MFADRESAMCRGDSYVRGGKAKSCQVYLHRRRASGLSGLLRRVITIQITIFPGGNSLMVLRTTICTDRNRLDLHLLKWISADFVSIDDKNHSGVFFQPASFKIHARDFILLYA